MQLDRGFRYVDDRLCRCDFDGERSGSALSTIARMANAILLGESLSSLLSPSNFGHRN